MNHPMHKFSSPVKPGVGPSSEPEKLGSQSDAKSVKPAGAKAPAVTPSTKSKRKPAAK